MNHNKHTKIEFNTEPTDDFSVLNYLLEHVHGISPTSLAPEYAFEDSTEIE